MTVPQIPPLLVCHDRSVMAEKCIFNGVDFVCPHRPPPPTNPPRSGLLLTGGSFTHMCKSTEVIARRSQGSDLAALPLLALSPSENSSGIGRFCRLQRDVGHKQGVKSFGHQFFIAVTRKMVFFVLVGAFKIPEGPSV